MQVEWQREVQLMERFATSREPPVRRNTRTIIQERTRKTEEKNEVNETDKRQRIDYDGQDESESGLSQIRKSTTHKSRYK